MSIILSKNTRERPSSFDRPSILLNSKYEVVPFHEETCHRELELLEAWCQDKERFSVRLFYGPGGRGKTRLLTEWCRRLRRKGWATGYLIDEPSDEQIQHLIHKGKKPLFVVIDYAEAKQWLRAFLMTTQRESSHRTRIILIAREAGDWWQMLETLGSFIRQYEPHEVPPVLAENQMRLRVFTHAAKAYAKYLCKPCPRLEPDLTDARFERVLYLHMAALAAVEGDPLHASTLLYETLKREEAFWTQGMQPEDQQVILARVRLFMAAVTLLNGVENEDAATKLQQRLYGGNERLDQRILLHLHNIYQTKDKYIGPLEPDLLGEELVRGILEKKLDTLSRIFAQAESKALQHGFWLLGRIDWKDEMSERIKQAIHDILLEDLSNRALPALNAALALGDERASIPLGAILAQALREQGSVALAKSLIPRLPHPQRTTALLDVGVWACEKALSVVTESPERRAALLNEASSWMSRVNRREEALEAVQEAVEIRRGLARNRPDAFLPNLAASLNNLGNALGDLGRREEALEATQEAVKIYRGLAKDRPDAFLPSLAPTLSNLSNRLSELGRREEALAAAQEAVEIRRSLAKDRPDAFLPDLAASLNSLGNALSELGRREEALEAAQEAAEICRALAKDRPDAFLPYLALSLNNLSNRLSELGRREEALEAAQEATEIHRGLAKDRPDAFLPVLATSLNNLAIKLSNLGQHEEALAATQEAAGIYRALAKDRPDAFLPGLALVLNSLSNRLRDLGQCGEALESAQEAAEIYRGLAKARPDVFLPALATSLNNLGVILRELGQLGEALETARETVEICRGLAKARPDVFLPVLATSLNNLGINLSNVGRCEEALEAAREAVDIRRSLVKDHPDVFLLDLAASLNNLGNVLSDLGRSEEALEAAREAVEIYRGLAKARSDVFLPDLAMSLNNLGIKLCKLGRHEEALEAAQEAVEIRRSLVKNRPDAFLPKLAQSLLNLGGCLWAMERLSEAHRSFADGILSLKPVFMALPNEFASLMGALVRNYMSLSEKIGEKPDDDLLEPMLDMLEISRQDAEVQ
ncbi:MAG: tetratricopeptide repeat protein [Bacteroidota bacterium]